jgi:hypothetical protein
VIVNTKAEVLLYTANTALSEASGAFMGDITKQSLKVSRGEEKEINFKGALKVAAKSLISAKLSPVDTKNINSFKMAVKTIKKEVKSVVKSTIVKSLQNKDVKFYKYK